MAAYLIAEEGPLVGLIVRFEAGDEWVLGRDPDESDIVLEDPMVSRRHAICRKTPDGYFLENLSSVNPATQNGKIIAEPILLQEGDVIQIGSTFFHFTEKEPTVEEEKKEEEEELETLQFGPVSEGRWMIKVVSGPNAGAEFLMQKGKSYVLGKDPNLCDIAFQDMSVSKEHARIAIDEEERVFIEDLGSRNGVFVNGELISDKRQLQSQDLLALGTTAFLVIDREGAQETIVPPPMQMPSRVEPAPAEEAPQEPLVEAPPRDWKEMVIPRKHLIFGGALGLFLLVIFASMFALFKSAPIAVHEKNEAEQIRDVTQKFSSVQFTYADSAGKLFLVGHVLTGVDHQELLYLLKGLPFVRSVEDNVVVDEYVWQNTNAMLSTNAGWVGVTLTSVAPGKFVLRGYLQTLEQAQALSDYLNLNFPYLDKLDNQVVVETNLQTQLQSMLAEKGFNNVSFQLTNGEIVLSGRVEGKHSSDFNRLVQSLKALQGIRVVLNFVVYTTADTSRVDVSTQYQVTGFSTQDEKSYYVVINGRILSVGDTLDGMMISEIMPSAVLLEKDGLKFRINYNLQ